MRYNNGYFEIDTNLESVMDSFGSYKLLECNNTMQEYEENNYKIVTFYSNDYVIIDSIYTNSNSSAKIQAIYEYYENLDGKSVDFECYSIKCNNIAEGDFIIRDFKDILKQEYHNSKKIPCKLFVKAYYDSVTALKDDNHYIYFFYKGFECIDMTKEYVNLFNYLIYMFISCDTCYRENYDDDFDSFVNDFMFGTFYADGHTIREGFLREDEFIDNLKIKYDIDYENEKIDLIVKGVCNND